MMSEPKDPNAHVREYLEYYVGLDKPGFAVLLTGDWGAGKTWLINDFIRRQGENKENRLFVNVSAYGASSVDDLGERIFAELHPFLGSKAARVGGKFLKGMFKFTFKVDYEDLSVEGQPGLPDGTISGGNSLGTKVLVIDDLERATLPWAEIMGFVNHIVEREQGHVILIASESKLEKQAAGYRETKEKNIGMTLEVVPDFDAALTGILADHSAIREQIPNHREHIMDVVSISGCKSLRLLRRGIQDFDRIYKSFETVRDDHRDDIVSILRTTLALSIEVGRNTLSPEEIYILPAPDLNMNIARMTGRKYENEAREREIESLYNKYDNNKVYMSYLRPNREWWRDFYAQGVLKKTPIEVWFGRTELSSSSWHRLSYRSSELSDEEYCNLMKETWEYLNQPEHVDEYAIMHISGQHLRSIANGLSDRDPAEVVRSAIAALDRLPLTPPDEKETMDNASAFRDYRRHAPHFASIAEHAEARREKARLANDLMLARKIMSHMEKSEVMQAKQLLKGERAILVHIDTGEFCQRLVALKPNPQLMLLWFIVARIQSSDQERAWAKDLLAEVRKLPTGNRKYHMTKELLNIPYIEDPQSEGEHSQDTSASSSPPSQIGSDEQSH